MKPIVYIDMLFFINLVMNTFTLYTTHLLLKREVSLLRLFLSAGVLSLYSCLIFFPEVKFLFSILMKIIVLGICSFIAFPSKHYILAIKNTITFFSVSMVYGGTMFFLIFATDFGTRVGAVVSNGEIYLDIKTSTLMIAAAFSYAFVYVVSYVKKIASFQAENLFKMKISAQGKTISIKAFGDTGCNLMEPITKKPAIIITKEVAEKIVPKDILKLIEDKKDIEILKEDPIKLYILPFSTLGDKKGILYGFSPKEVFINGARIENSVIAISEGPICMNFEFDAIFNPSILKERESIYV